MNYSSDKTIYWCFRTFLTLFIILVTLHNTAGQDSEKSVTDFKNGSYESTFSTSRIALAQSVMVTPKSEFHFVIQHRFYELTSSINDFFGLDYASTRLGFEYGIFSWLSAAIGRSMSVKTYDLAFKGLILKQEQDNMPLSLSWYTSFLENTSQTPDWEGHDTFGSRMSYVNQLFLSRNQGILSFQVSPIWVHSNYDYRKDAPMDVYAIDLAGRVALGDRFGIIAEYIPVLSNEAFIDANPFTIGLDINTGGHQFQVFLSNSQGTNEKEFMTNTSGSWSKGKIYLGFNLTRVFNPQMY